MSDLAVSEGLSGQIALYDLNLEAAHRNAAIGQRINQNPAAKSHFEYTVCPNAWVLNFTNPMSICVKTLCSSLTMEQCEELFRQMCYNTREYLDPYFDLDAYFR